MLKPVKILTTAPLIRPDYIKTQSVVYIREDQKGIWEMVNSHDTVHILVNNLTTQELLFVKQVRIPVLVNNPDTDGTVIECCAGIIDKYKGEHPDIRALLIARDEIQEELGYVIPYSNIKKIREIKSSVGITGSTAHIFFATTIEHEYIGQKLNGLEDIEVIKVPYSNVLEFIKNSTTDAITISLTYWWLHHIEQG